MSNTGTHSHPFQANVRNSAADIMRDQQIVKRGPSTRAGMEAGKPKIVEMTSGWPFPLPTGTSVGPAPYEHMKSNTLARNLSTQNHGG